MSYLSQLKNRQITAAQALAKSVAYLRDKLGVGLTDAQIDQAVDATDRMTDELEVVLANYIAKHFPALPPAIAVAASTAALNVVDAAVAGAANVVKSKT